MATTTFTSGTVIASTWLNDVNTVTYKRTLGMYSVREYGAVGDGVTDDTTSITNAYAAALAAGYELIVGSGQWAVTKVTFSGDGATVRMAGNARLIGIAAVSTTCVLEITGRQMVGWNFQIDQNFNTNYTKGAVWWHSVSAILPAQFNRIVGMKVLNCVRGLVYGDIVGSVAVDAPQSENTIENFSTRACQICFEGNQPNGFLTLISPVLDCNPNEWSAQGGYNAATYATAAKCIYNPTAISSNFCVHLNIIGGEILKTFSTLGYGIHGGGITISAPNAIEIAGVQGYIDNFFSVSDLTNSAMTAGGVAASALNAFVVDPAIAALAFIYFRNCSWNRTTAGSSAASTASFIAAASGSPACQVHIIDCQLQEWRWDSTVPLVSGLNVTQFFNTFVTVNTRGAFTSVQQTPLGITAATGTILHTDVEVLVNFAGTCTLTLPSAASYPGKYIHILTLTANTVVSASSNVIALGGTANGTAILAATIGKWATLQSSGSSWRILRAN